MAARRTHRFPLMLTTEEVEALDGYRWRNKVSTQAQAVRLLMEAGFAVEAAQKSEGPVAPTTSPSKATTETLAQEISK